MVIVRQHVRLHRRGEEGEHRPPSSKARRVQDSSAPCEEARRLRVPLAVVHREQLAEQMPRGGPAPPRVERHDEARRGPRRQGRADAWRQRQPLPDWVVRATDPRVPSTQSRASAWLKASPRGCSRTCAFCVIPQNPRQAAVACGGGRHRGRRGRTARGGRRHLRAEPRPPRTPSPTGVDLAKDERTHAFSRGGAPRGRREGGSLGAPSFYLTRRPSTRPSSSSCSPATRASCPTSTCRSSTRPTRC